MKSSWVIIALSLAITILNVSFASASAKVALVVGNSKYQNAALLKNAVSDANAVGNVLEKLGFQVTLKEDVDKRIFETALADFAEQALNADIALIYYAGHAIERNGENFFIPTDASLSSDARIGFETVSLQDFLDSVAGAKVLRLVLLDSCRDNPFENNMRTTGKTRSIGRGLARPPEQEPGLLISYAAAAGTTAQDGDGDHSPYAEALLNNLETPSLEISLLFRKIRADVKKATNNRQTPFEYGSLPDNEIFLSSLSTKTDIATGPITFRDCDLCPEMVTLPAGEFTMGASDDSGNEDEKPQRTVTIAEPFAVGRFEVTRGEFSKFVVDANYKVPGGCAFFDGKVWKTSPEASWKNPPAIGRSVGDVSPELSDDVPVTCLSWEDTVAYTRWLSSKTNANYRLLSEAEWEYAARGSTKAGTYTLFAFGSEIADACKYANVADISAKNSFPQWATVACDDGFVAASPKGSFLPNNFGLHDMAGNVWEWVADCWNDDHASAPTDGRVRESGDCERNVLRGGAWLPEPENIRPTDRFFGKTNDRMFSRGFRVTRAL